MLRVYTLTDRMFTRLSRKPKLLKCYDCGQRFGLESLVVSTTYGNSCKLRCPKCAVKYGVVSRKEVSEVSEKN